MTRLALTRLPLCAAAALAACSAEPQHNEAAPAPSATAKAAAETPTVRDSAAVPHPGVLKTFGDWTVGCDNALSCGLRSLQPETAEPGGVTVAVARAAGPSGAIALTVGGDDEETLTADVDGQHGVPRSAAKIVAAMANAPRLVAWNDAKAVATVSLKGASAALRYVDAVQGRAGTVTATVARGPRLASVVPTPPALPVIVAVAPDGQAGTPSAAELATMRRTAGCDAEGLDAPDIHALGGGRTLVLLPCSAGAYNLRSAVFVLDGKGVAPVRADAPMGFTEGGAPAVPSAVNAAFRGGVLTSYAKARGVGDCGVIQEWVWDGTRLRLMKQREMGECRGNTDYITTWRANVVRR